MDRPEQRRTERLTLSIPIRVIGFDPATGEFSEDTHTLVVNRGGARIALNCAVTAGDTIRIINLENYNEADFTVVGPTRLEGAQAAEWGVECQDLGRNIWGIDLPPPLGVGGEEAGVLLECRACHKQSLCLVSFMQVDVLESTGAVARTCDQCGKETFWTYAETTRRPREFGPGEPVAPLRRAPEVKKAVEKRTAKRLAMKLPVLVRSQKGEAEVTKTENLSKGGFAVSLSMELDVGEVVTVVCPYTPGGQNIEQKAEVRRRATYSFGGVRFYGFAFLH